MKQFARHRTIEELEEVCKQNGWKFKKDHYETGSDYVSFAFKLGRVSGTACVNVFNGNFFGETASKIVFASKENTHENKRLFQGLLSAVYVEADAAKKAA